MTWKAFDYDPGKLYSISTANSSDTVTVTVNGNEVDLTQQLDLGVNKTPSDPMEEAELILAGICPKCRQENGEHDYLCSDWVATDLNLSAGTVTIGTSYGPSINLGPGPGITLDPTIHVGNNTLTEDKLNKLDYILDRFDDLDIDKIIKFMDKLPDDTD